MEKERETIDALMNSQKEFMDACMKTQKQFLENMTESTRKMQEGFMHACGQGGAVSFIPKEAMGAYNTMIETMLSSTKAFAEEAVKMQETWNNTLARQMEVCMKMASNIFETGRQKEAA